MSAQKCSLLSFTFSQCWCIWDWTLFSASLLAFSMMNPRGLYAFVFLLVLPWPSWASSYRGRKLWRVRWRRSLWTTGCCTRPPQFHHHRRHSLRRTVDPSGWQLCERKETHSVILRNSVKQCGFAFHVTFNVRVCVCVLCAFFIQTAQTQLGSIACWKTLRDT